METEDTYALCRCGHSGSKPFCDGTHAVIGFDGTESPVMRPYKELQHMHDGVGISAQRVGELCIHAAFCIGRTRPIAEMLADTGDSDVRSNIMGRIDHCPSGSYSYALERGGETIEQAYATAQWITRHGVEEGLDASRLAVAGDSVGGNMTAALTILAKRRGDVTFVHQSLYYPVTDAAQDTGSYREFADGPYLTAKAMAWFWDAYTTDSALRQNDPQGIPATIGLAP
ncbi:alpha/beta hydrolase fold domain-containing protein [Planotetraspora sp. GP83]|uniref:alpha/beta hydrolase fold domain-containing protein n=1 Tax=Planotetraspora sp. GP83 TaxID=3156264 RepID=UPI003510E5A4